MQLLQNVCNTQKKVEGELSGRSGPSPSKRLNKLQQGKKACEKRYVTALLHWMNTCQHAVA